MTKEEGMARIHEFKVEIDIGGYQRLSLEGGDVLAEIVKDAIQSLRPKIYKAAREQLTHEVGRGRWILRLEVERLDPAGV